MARFGHGVVPQSEIVPEPTIPSIPFNGPSKAWPSDEKNLPRVPEFARSGHPVVVVDNVVVVPSCHISSSSNWQEQQQSCHTGQGIHAVTPIPEIGAWLSSSIEMEGRNTAFSSLRQPQARNLRLTFSSKVCRTSSGGERGLLSFSKLRLPPVPYPPKGLKCSTKTALSTVTKRPQEIFPANSARP